MQDISYFIKRVGTKLLRSKLGRILPDKLYLQIYYFLEMDGKLNLSYPLTINEKHQWLKLYDRKDTYTEMVDKYKVRRYVAKQLHSSYLIPLYGVYEDPQEIDFTKLPNEFVIKSTHSSGQVMIIKDKAKINERSVKKEINKWLKENLYFRHREWPYKNVKPRVIIEKLLSNNSGEEVKDYKFHVFHGKVKMIQVNFDKENRKEGRGYRSNIYNSEWELLPFSIARPNDPGTIIRKPHNLDHMLRVASILGESIPYVRVDLYLVNDNIYFGELTFFPGGGYQKYNPTTYGEKVGNWLEMSKMKP